MQMKYKLNYPRWKCDSFYVICRCKVVVGGRKLYNYFRIAVAAILALSLRWLGRKEVATLGPGAGAKGEDGRDPKKTQAITLLLGQKTSLHFLFQK